MKELIITSTPFDAIKITWDGERFAIIARGGDLTKIKVIILNPIEAEKLAGFIKEQTQSSDRQMHIELRREAIAQEEGI